MKDENLDKYIEEAMYLPDDAEIVIGVGDLKELLNAYIEQKHVPAMELDPEIQVLISKYNRLIARLSTHIDAITDEMKNLAEFTRTNQEMPQANDFFPEIGEIEEDNPDDQDEDGSGGHFNSRR